MVEARSAIADELVLVDPEPGGEPPHGHGSCAKRAGAASATPPARLRAPVELPAG